MDKKMTEGNIKKKSSNRGLELLKIFSLSAVCTLLFVSCGSNTISPDNIEYGRSPGRHSGNAVIYNNSFETEKDTAGWSGIYPEMFVNDAAPEGGAKSLLIGGGCYQPAGSISLTIEKEGKYSMSLWEKTSDTGGILSIVIEGNDTSVSESVSLNSKAWKYHKLDNLYFPANSKITLNIWAGGFVFASANIDELKIEKIE